MDHKKNRFPCPCCGYLTIEHTGHYEVCPVCFWEDDPLQSEDTNYDGGANAITLCQAKVNFKTYGAITAEFVAVVRKPHACEVPHTTGNEV